MFTLITVFGVSFLFCFFLTPIARGLAARYRLVDRPDGERKLQARPTPTAGGLVVLLSGCASIVVLLLVPSPLGDFVRGHGTGLWQLLLGAVLLSGVGVVDDYRRLRGRHKLLGQLLAIVVVLSSGLEVRSIRLCDWTIDLGVFSLPFTIFWLLGAINALNLLDGMDGLLGSVGLIIGLAIAAMAVVNNQWVAACVALALAGALLGFLNYNLPPASIFLGDTGSMLIGLVIGVLGIQSFLKGPATIALATPVAFLTIPIFDTTAAIVRRKLTGRSIYSTDRGHLHHCLLGKGFTNQRVLVRVASLCLVTVLGALLSLAYYNDLLAILSSLMVIGILIGTKLFGYAEWLLIKQRFVSFARLFLQRARGQAPKLPPAFAESDPH